MGTKFTQKGLQSQKKAYSNESTGAVGGTLAKGLAINTPGLNPQAAPVDSFVRTGRPNAPGAVQLGELARLPEPAEITDLKNLTQQLGQLNSNLQNAAAGFFADQGRREEEAALKAKSIIEQTPNDTGRNPEETLAQIGKEMIVISSNPENDIKERRGAEKVLSQLQNDGRLKRHINSELKKQQVITNASNLKQTLSGLYVKNEAGEDVPFNSISSSDPRYLEIIKPRIYGDIELSPKEYNDVSGTITNTLANYKATHDKNHKTYLINELRLSQATRIKEIGNTLGTNGTSSVVESVINLQTVLDETRLKLPGLSTEQNNKVSTTLISDLVSGFMRNNKGANTDALEEVLSSLMIGPVEGRTKQVENADGSVSTIINEKQRWINQFGGEPWLEQQIITAKYNLAELDNKEEKAYIITEKNEADDSLRDGTDEDPSVLKLIQEKDFERARTKLEELKTNYRTKAIANNVDSSAIAEVLDHYDSVFKKFTKADSFDMNSRMTEISKLLPYAVTVADSAKILELVDSLEDEYGYDKNVVDFGLKVREKVAFSKQPQVKARIDQLKKMLGDIEKDWMKYGKQSYSADGEDSTVERSQFLNAYANGMDIGTEIIIRNLKNNTPGNIEKELQAAITRRALGLEKETEKKWSTDQGVEFEGNYESSLDDVSDQFKLDRADIGPNNRQKLIRSVQSYKPMFGADTIRDMATKAFEGKMDRRLRRILIESGMKPGDFFVEQMEKFNGYIELSKQERDNLLRLNEVPL
tara:strand:- start:7515 stop:9788 length:2274 start_codon:yes stop_codon:yes gene_type:complete